MNRWIYRLAWSVGVLLVVLLIVISTANYFLNKPVFREKVEQQVSRALKMPVRFSALRLKWNGIKIKNLEIPYQETSTNPFFAQTKALGLSLSFWNLLRGQVILDAIVLNEPQVLLQENFQGKVVLPHLTQKSKQSSIESSNISTESAETIAEPAKDFSQSLPYALEEKASSGSPKRRGYNQFNVDTVQINQGWFQYRDQKEAKVTCENIQAEGDFFTAPSELKSHGEVQIDKIVVEPKMVITDFESPVIYTNEVLILPEIKADFYRGTLAGFFKARFDKELQPFRGEIQMQDFDLENFLKERNQGSSPIEGRGNLNFKGRGQFKKAENIQGEGDFLIQSFRAEGSPFFREVGSILGVPGLADITFEKVMGQFRIQNQEVIFDKIETQPRKNATYLVGKGTIDFKGNLNFDAALTLNSGAIGNLSQLLGKALGKDSEGAVTIPFKVTGTTDNPKVRLAAQEATSEVLRDLFELIPEMRF